MSNFILITLTFSLLNFCSTNQVQSKLTLNNKSENKLIGFVYIKISNIYYQNGMVVLVDTKQDTILSIENKSLSIDGKNYKIIDEEYLYKKNINVKAFDAEYGIFVLECYGLIDGFYQVKINDQIGLINNDNFKEYIEFKDFEKYIMDTRPIPTQKNPLRIKPNETSEIIEEFNKWAFIPVEVNGDWVKVKDDKDCYPGVAPSPTDITGWIRWRKDGEFILKVAYTC
jgi:hypothetical protein